jgi:hypothetical protein
MTREYVYDQGFAQERVGHLPPRRGRGTVVGHGGSENIRVFTSLMVAAIGRRS